MESAIARSKTPTQSCARSRSRSRSKDNGKSKENKKKKMAKSIKSIKWDSDKHAPLNQISKDPRIEVLVERKTTFFQEKYNPNRLFLVLDLDDTLVNLNDDAKKDLIIKGKDNITIPKKIEPRAHLNSFLEEIGRYYDIFIYSHGDKPYVEACISMLNSAKQLRPEFYASGIDSRVTDQTRKHLSKLNIMKKENKPFSLEELLERTLIVDDTFGVWEDAHDKNLIVSKKFYPFKETQFEIDKVKGGYYINKHILFDFSFRQLYIERDLPKVKKGQLFFLKNILIKIAKIFYIKKKLKNVLAESISDILNMERRKILAGKNIFFANLSPDSNSPLNNLNSIKKIIGLMGGDISLEEAVLKYKTKRIDYFIVNTIEIPKAEEGALQRLNKTIETLKKSEYYANVPILTESWILDCFFFLFEVPTCDYLYK